MYTYKDIELGCDLGTSDTDSLWVIRPGKADRSNEYYVSIESENKSGLYLTAKEDGTVVLTQDTDGSKKSYDSQTFETVEDLDGKEDSVSFRSLAFEDKYISMVDGNLILTDAEDPAVCSFVLLKN